MQPFFIALFREERGEQKKGAFFVSSVGLDHARLSLYPSPLGLSLFWDVSLCRKKIRKDVCKRHIHAKSKRKGGKNNKRNMKSAKTQQKRFIILFESTGAGTDRSTR